MLAEHKGPSMTNQEPFDKELAARKAEFAKELEETRKQRSDSEAALNAERSRLETVLKEAAEEAAQQRRVFEAATWRATRQARAIASLLPAQWRWLARRSAKAIYRAATPHRLPVWLAFLRDRAARLAIGMSELPNELFDAEWYLREYSDVKAAGIGPLEHYLWHGKLEGRLPRPPHHYYSGLPIGERTTLVRDTLSLVYIAGEPDTPGLQYRVVRYIDAAIAAGAKATWMRADEISQRLGELESAEVLIIWRAVWNAQIKDAVELMRSQKKPIVFDVDDLMVDPRLARVEVIDGIRSQGLTENGTRAYYSKIRDTMLSADLCFAPTDELASYTRQAGKTTFVLPNGFDQPTHDRSRRIVRQRQLAAGDNLVRIGYAGGSKTHQRDFAITVEAIAKVLREEDASRLVLFRKEHVPLIDIDEFAALAGLEEKIEWRDLQPLSTLADELGRFDINLAPLEIDNDYCQAKSELKFFEAALVEVPTIASPTGPFRRAIEHGKTGFLAANVVDWYVYLKQLVRDPLLRSRVAHQAYHATLAKYGPLQRTEQMSRVLDQLRGGRAAAHAFALSSHLSSVAMKTPKVFKSDVVFYSDALRDAAVTVMIPLYNYEKYIIEALESVRAQTLVEIDLVIVDGCSSDCSLSVAKEWVARNAARFNRIVILKNHENYGLGLCRNSGIDVAETPYVMLLDADNRLLPGCCEELLRTIRESSVAFAYSTVRRFGSKNSVLCNAPYEPQRLVPRNYIDAMALLSKQAWAMVGGFEHVRHGWEDYDFWCRLAEIGLRGEWVPSILAEYRVHGSSMGHTVTAKMENYRSVMENMTLRHRWVSLLELKQTLRIPKGWMKIADSGANSRLTDLLPILRCPETKQKLVIDGDGKLVVGVDGMRSWPIISGRPILAPGLKEPKVMAPEHTSNELSDEAKAMIHEANGWVLNLSAGGTTEKLEHVVEMEYAIFRHTDVVGDAHALPFDDETFSLIVAFNAFEHYRAPDKVAAELYRVLKPGGRVLIRTAFMQPLHEKPLHFFNCTRYGLSDWFQAFEQEQMRVSPNFCPNYSMAWLASECEEALRRDVSPQSAAQFASSSVGTFVKMWRDQSTRSSPLWTDFERLSQPTQEVVAAGFEYIGRRPEMKPPRL